MTRSKGDVRLVLGNYPARFEEIFSTNSSRAEVSPLLQGLAIGEFANPVLTAALASAKWPLPIENPLKALTSRPARNGFGLAPKLYFIFFQLSPDWYLVPNAPL